jgi:LmbE family N-acetylglucosaminyl deacetylase
MFDTARLTDTAARPLSSRPPADPIQAPETRESHWAGWPVLERLQPYPLEAVTPAELARRRRQEDLDSLSRLGIDEREVIRLGLPDGALADYEGELAEIVDRMAEGFGLCLAPWSGDLHPDHEAVAAGRAHRHRRAGDGRRGRGRRVPPQPDPPPRAARRGRRDPPGRRPRAFPAPLRSGVHVIQPRPADAA